MNKFYLAGPMTGYPKFNFPAFYEAASNMRAMGLEIISPAELDKDSGVAEKAMRSTNGQLGDADIKETWGDMLARDVKLIADGVDGIIFLDGWQGSRGARLEAFVGVLCEREFYLYSAGAVTEITRHQVLEEIYLATI